MSHAVSLNTVDSRINLRLNSVQHIITNFSSLSPKQKLEIKILGRPTPELKLTQSGSKKKEGRSFIRHFNERMYQKNNWICGCDVKNSLFCFPCLLFHSSSKDRSWSRTGVTDLNHLQEKIKKHELSKSHLQACMEFALLDEVVITKDLSTVYHLEIAKHNEDVKKNRHILRSLISCVKFHGIFESTLSGNNGEEGSLNRGIFQQLMNYSADFNNVLKEHIRNSKVFNGNSKLIENEILESMLTVCKTEILKEVSSADFLAVQCEETTDVSNHCQMAIILRYIKENTLREHFWTFVRIFDATANGLVNSIHQEVDPMLKYNTTKLIAFACSGVNVLRGSIGDVQIEMREKYPNAYLVNCYAHHLNSIMQKAACQNTRVRAFFNDLSRIKVFLSNSNRIEILAAIVRMRLPLVGPNRWTSNSIVVNTVHENRENLILCFQEIFEKTELKSTGEGAIALVKTLENYQFIFWLTFFHKVYPHVDKLHNQFNSQNEDDVTLQMRISIFEASIQKIRNETEVIDRECRTENIVKRKRLIDSDRMSITAK